MYSYEIVWLELPYTDGQAPLRCHKFPNEKWRVTLRFQVEIYYRPAKQYKLLLLLLVCGKDPIAEDTIPFAHKAWKIKLLLIENVLPDG